MVSRDHRACRCADPADHPRAVRRAARSEQKWRTHRRSLHTRSMTFPALQPLADRAALFVALRQEALTAAAERLGEHRWDADMTAGTLTFTSNANPEQQLVSAAHLVATIAPGPRSLLWAWAHPQGDPNGIAGQLRDY